VNKLWPGNAWHGLYSWEKKCMAWLHKLQVCIELTMGWGLIKVVCSFQMDYYFDRLCCYQSNENQDRAHSTSWPSNCIAIHASYELLMWIQLRFFSPLSCRLCCELRFFSCKSSSPTKSKLPGKMAVHVVQNHEDCLILMEIDHSYYFSIHA
jgi:hypothetical protein